ncbi:MAG: 16S rRNA (uracil(1498)-N(3))-methyltransferase [Brumimicrobium sp.]|nr:16S rRNA (uracil(1498)-N(3))-methyltransferase [Brumimicrobium sp.]MCO5269378.1 16S rRNA (uracil(1498)-N(3))-methyltransferase [Brumimicrobium sp.]
MNRFFLELDSLDNDILTLSEEESKHAAKVLRLQNGDSVEVINGKGELFLGEILDNAHKRMMIQRKEHLVQPKDDYHIHIAIAPTKNNDRFEWFLEKATELGIHEITPLLCDNSERKVINKDRFEKILVSAVKQSKRLFLPKLNDLTKLDVFLKNNPNGLLAHCYEDSSKNTTISKEIMKNSQRWLVQNTPILIGPEGDFSQNEVQKATQNGYQFVTLGKTRLRTETAGVFACASCKLFLEENNA